MRRGYEERFYTIYETVKMPDGSTVKMFLDCHGSRSKAFEVARRLGQTRRWAIIETTRKEIATSQAVEDEVLELIDGDA